MEPGLEELPVLDSEQAHRQRGSSVREKQRKQSPGGKRSSRSVFSDTDINSLSGRDVASRTRRLGIAALAGAKSISALRRPAIPSVPYRRRHRHMTTCRLHARSVCPVW